MIKFERNFLKDEVVYVAFLLVFSHILFSYIFANPDSQLSVSVDSATPLRDEQVVSRQHI